MAAEDDLYGYLVEFDRVEDLVAGARAVTTAGYRRLEAYTPFPVEALDGILPPTRDLVFPIVLASGIAGGLLGYGLQYWTAVVDYPLLVGGKPMHAWTAFIPVTFELIVLFAAIAAVLAAIWCNGLPRLNHPLFGVPGFDLATRNRFFLVVEAADPAFDPRRTREELERLPQRGITAVRWE